VTTSTRVECGPVVPIYAGGGGTDLLAAGAVPAGALRPSQARVLLILLLATHTDPAVVRDQLAAHVAGAPDDV